MDPSGSITTLEPLRHQCTGRHRHLLSPETTCPPTIPLNKRMSGKTTNVSETYDPVNRERNNCCIFFFSSSVTAHQKCSIKRKKLSKLNENTCKCHILYTVQGSKSNKKESTGSSPAAMIVHRPSDERRRRPIELRPMRRPLLVFGRHTSCRLRVEPPWWPIASTASTVHTATSVANRTVTQTMHHTATPITSRIASWVLRPRKSHRSSSVVRTMRPAGSLPLWLWDMKWCPQVE